MISIDFGSDFTKIVVGRFKNDVVIIEKAHTFETPDDVYEDGVVVQSDSLKKEISKFLNRNKIRKSKVVCTFNSSRLIIREIEIPNAKISLLGALIKYEMEKYLPIVLREYVLEYKVLEEVEDGKTLRILVTALPKSIAVSYYALLQEIGLQPLSLSTHSHALEKLFALSRDSKIVEDPAAVLEIGHREIVINMIENRKLWFSRTLTQQSNEVLDRSVEAWGIEIQRVLQFYNNNGLNRAMKKVYLYGENVNFNELEIYLRQRLHVKTERIQDMHSVILNSSTTSYREANYIHAAGAMIR